MPEAPIATVDALRKWKPPIYRDIPVRLNKKWDFNRAGIELPKDPPDLTDWQEQAWYRLKRCVAQMVSDDPDSNPVEAHHAMHTIFETLSNTSATMSNTSATIHIQLKVEVCAVLSKSQVQDIEASINSHPISFEESIDEIFQIWVDIDVDHPGEFHNPIEPIVRAWQQEQIPIVEPETRKTQIAPDFLRGSRPSENAELLPIGEIHTPCETQPMLPGFESQSVIVPALPLQVYEAAGGKPAKGGKGAPLEQRMLISALCAYPQGQRELDDAMRLETTLRDITRWLYPTRAFHRRNDLPRIHKALHNLHNLRITYERRDWNVVQVFALPNWETKLDDPLPLYIRMPDGVKDNGAMIDVEQMQLYGVKSAPKFRAWIRLAYFWDRAKIRSGGYRIYATIPEVQRNKDGYITDALGEVICTGMLYRTKSGWKFRQGNIPQTAWYHPLAVVIGEERNPEADKVPVMDSTDLVHLFFDDKPQTPGTFRFRKHSALKFAHEMHEEGVIVLEEGVICQNTGKRGYRILQPRQKALITD